MTKLRESACSKRAKVEATFPSPSDFGKSRPTNVPLLNHRSSTGSLSGLHVGLQVEAFGHFIDQMNIKDDEISPLFYTVAGSLMKSMSAHYPNEHQQQNEFLEAVSEIFTLKTCRFGRAQSDGAYLATINEKQYHLANFEFIFSLRNVEER